MGIIHDCDCDLRNSALFRDPIFSLLTPSAPIESYIWGDVQSQCFFFFFFYS